MRECARAVCRGARRGKYFTLCLLLEGRGSGWFELILKLDNAIWYGVGSTSSSTAHHVITIRGRV